MMVKENVTANHLQQLVDRAIRDFVTLDFDGKISFAEFGRGIEMTKIRLENQLNLEWYSRLVVTVQ